MSNTVKKKFSIIQGRKRSENSIPYNLVHQDPTQDHKIDIPRYRKEIQYLSEATPIGKAAVQNFPGLVIGAGLNLRPAFTGYERSRLKEIYKAINELWEDFVSTAHINGQDDFSTCLRAIVAAVIRDGDCLVYKTIDSYTQKLKIDIIPGDRIESPSDSWFKKNLPDTWIEDKPIDTWWPGKPPESWVSGKEIPLTKMGVLIQQRKVIGYFAKNDNGTNGYSFFPTNDANGNFISFLVKNPNGTDRLGSYRGIPVLAAAQRSIYNLDDTMTTELIATDLSRKVLGVIESDDPTGISQDISEYIDSNVGTTKLGDVEFMVSPPNTKVTIHKGTDVSNPNIGKIVKIYLEQISSVLNVPYNSLFSQLEDNSYSTNQGIKQQAFENTKIWRDYFAKNIIKPLYTEMFKSWVFDGRIPYIKSFSIDLTKVIISEKPISSIKQKDVYEAQSLAIESGLKSRTQICLENGDDALSILRDQLEYEAEKQEIEEELKKPNKQNSLSELDLKKNEQIFGILDKVAVGTLSKEQAKICLIDMFNYSEEKAMEYLGLKVA